MLAAEKKQAILDSFARQRLMELFGAEVLDIAEGRFEIGLSPKTGLLRSSGAFNGGVLSALADTAGGFAVITVIREMQPYLVTVSLSIDYLKPAIGDKIIARARPIKVGKTISVASIEIFAGVRDKIVKVAVAMVNYMQIKPKNYE